LIFVAFDLENAFHLHIPLATKQIKKEVQSKKWFFCFLKTSTKCGDDCSTRRYRYRFDDEKRSQ
jgi:hypothetical protein